MHNEKLHYMYTSLKVKGGQMKEDEMDGAYGRNGNAYNILVEKSEGRRPTLKSKI
jgi:hypothetical protein